MSGDIPRMLLNLYAGDIGRTSSNRFAPGPRRQVKGSRIFCISTLYRWGRQEDEVTLEGSLELAHVGEYAYVALRKDSGGNLLKLLGKLVKKLAKSEAVASIELPRMLTLTDEDSEQPMEYLQIAVSIKKSCAVKCGSSTVDLAEVLSSTSVLANLAVGVSYSAEVPRKAPISEDGSTKVCDMGQLKLSLFAAALTDVAALVGSPMGESAQLTEVAPSEQMDLSSICASHDAIQGFCWQTKS
eukprot:Skav235953  [mRNA]  locus=scaffold530:217676:221468:+ [translate_table: standard]